jgi:hypothetical protein
MLFDRISTVQSTNPYFSKDLAKAARANKFIGRGSAASSTNKYRIAAGDLANCGSYTSTDVVFVSAEGDRRGRHPIDTDELALAISAGVTFITDNASNRNRRYNVGERQVASLLESEGYTEVNPGVWKIV